jgi:hypothetical protein
MARETQRKDNSIFAVLMVFILGSVMAAALVYWEAAQNMSLRADRGLPPAAGGGIANFSDATTGQR